MKFLYAILILSLIIATALESEVKVPKIKFITNCDGAIFINDYLIW